MEHIFNLMSEMGGGPEATLLLVLFSVVSALWTLFVIGIIYGVIIALITTITAKAKAEKELANIEK